MVVTAQLVKVEIYELWPKVLPKADWMRDEGLRTWVLVN